MAGGATTADGRDTWCCRPGEMVLIKNPPSADFLIRAAEKENEAATVALWRACGLVASYNDPHADFWFARAGAASDVLVAVDGNGRTVGWAASWLVTTDIGVGSTTSLPTQALARAGSAARWCERPRRGCEREAYARRSC